MPQKANIWGIGNLKTTYERVFNHEKGDYEKIPKKRCTGTVDFPVLATEAGIYEDCDIYIYTKAEHEVKELEAKSPEKRDAEMHEKIDLAIALLIEVAKLSVEDK